MAEQRIRVLYIDDNADMRRLFDFFIAYAQDIENAGTMASADDLETRLADVPADVVVMDLSMPGRNPLEAIREARVRFPEVRFLVSSCYEDDERIERSFAAGAAGYLVKDGDYERLAKAIRSVAQGEKVAP